MDKTSVGPCSGKAETTTPGQPVGNCSAGSSSTGKVVPLPGCKTKGPLAGKD